MFVSSFMQVTSDGDMVFELDSPHKKPYEILMIGRKQSPATSNQTTSAPPTFNQTTSALPTSTSAPPTFNQTSNKETALDISSASWSSSYPAIPERYMFMCVPSKVHSQKPFIGGKVTDMYVYMYIACML